MKKSFMCMCEYGCRSLMVQLLSLILDWAENKFVRYLLRHTQFSYQLKWKATTKFNANAYNTRVFSSFSFWGFCEMAFYKIGSALVCLLCLLFDFIWMVCMCVWFSLLVFLTIISTKSRCVSTFTVVTILFPARLINGLKRHRATNQICAPKQVYWGIKRTGSQLENNHIFLFDRIPFIEWEKDQQYKKKILYKLFYIMSFVNLDSIQNFLYRTKIQTNFDFQWNENQNKHRK